MNNKLFPPEIAYHLPRISKITVGWLEEKFDKYSLGHPLQLDTKGFIHLNKLADFYLFLISEEAPIDAEIAYIAVKLGVITGKLSKIVNIDWKNRVSSVIAYQALASVFLSNFDEAERLIKIAEKKAYEEKDDAVLMETWGIWIYLENARYGYYKGLQLYDKAITFFDTIKVEEKKKLLSPYLQWVRIAGAKSLLKTGNIRQCLLLNQDALNQANKNGDRFFKAFALLGIGHGLDSIGQAKESVRLYKKAISISQTIQAPNLTSIIYNRLGMATAWQLRNIDESTEYFQRAILFSNRGEGSWLREGPQWNLASVYQAKGQYNKAIETMQEIAFNARVRGESMTELSATLNLAQLFKKIGMETEAKKTLEAGESLAKIMGMRIRNPLVEDDEEEEDLDFEEIDDYFDEFTDDLDVEKNDFTLDELNLNIDLESDDLDEDSNLSDDDK